MSTERTERTEGDTKGTGSLRDRVLQEKEPSHVRMGGLLDEDVYFLTLYPYLNGNRTPIIVTSEGELLEVHDKLKDMQQGDRELTAEEKESYNYQYFDYDGEEYRFETRVSWPEASLYSPKKKTIEYLDEPPSEDIFSRVTGIIERFWDHNEEQWYPVVAAYAFHTYLINLRGVTAYLVLNGKKDTGKSTLQKVLARLTYNGYFTGDTTPAVSARLANIAQATIHQEEVDKMGQAKRNRLQGVYNNGYQRGGKYTFTNTEAWSVDGEIRTLHTFCPKSLSLRSIHSLEGDFLSRSLIIDTVRTGREVEDIDSITEEVEEEFQDLQDAIAAYCILNWKDINGSIDDMQRQMAAEGRKKDIIGFITGIIHHFEGEEKALEVTEFLEEKTEMKSDGIEERQKALLQYLVRGMGDKERIEFSAKEAASHVNEEVGVDEGDEFALSARGVRRKLDDFNLVRNDEQVARKGSGGNTHYFVPREYLEDALQRFEQDGLLEQLEPGGSSNTPSVSSVRSVGRAPVFSLEDLSDSDALVEYIQEGSGLAERAVKSLLDRKVEETLDIDFQRSGSPSPQDSLQSTMEPELSREKLKELIEGMDDGEGVLYQEILDAVDVPESRVEEMLDDMLYDGVIYEAAPDKVSTF